MSKLTKAMSYASIKGLRVEAEWVVEVKELEAQIQGLKEKVIYWNLEYEKQYKESQRLYDKLGKIRALLSR